MKPTQLLTILLLFLVLPLVGCSEQKTEVDFIFMKTSDKTQPYWEQVIADFQAQNPQIRVNLSVLTWEEGPSQIATLIEQGTPPTLARVATRWVPGYTSKGWIEPIDKYLTPEFKNKFDPKLLNEGSQYQGRTFGLPVTTGTRALYYNKDLFKRAGLTNPPKTWAELKKDAAAISKLGIPGFGIDGGGVEAATYFYYFLWGNGGDVLTADGTQAAFNSSSGVEALTFLQGLVADGVTQPDPTLDDRKALETGFVEGRFGMVVTGPWLATRLAKEAPNLNYDVAPIPYNVKSVTLAAEDTLVLFKIANDESKKAAWKFVEFLYQDKYRLAYALQEGVLPETISVAKDPTFIQNSKMSFFMSLLPEGKFEPLNTKSADIASQVGKVMKWVYLKRSTPQDALNKAAVAVNETLFYSATAW